MNEARWTIFLCACWLLALLVTSPEASSVPLVAVQGLAGCLAITASVTDWHTLRLPAHLTFPAAVTAVAGVGLWGEGWLQALAGGLCGFALLKCAQIFARWRHKRECLGSGDAVLMLSLGSVLGIAKLFLGVCIAASLAVYAVNLSRTRRDRMPFGPFLTGGCLLSLLGYNLFTQ
jgi:prepilin signal peptidase PulO-like enzyme (type II secretory pathway)